MPAGVLASALLLGLYARGGNCYLFGFIALVPWLLALEASKTRLRSLAAGYGMSLCFTAAAFGWFASAIGTFTGLGDGGGWLLLLLAAPLLQPQVLVFAGVRHAFRRNGGGAGRALSCACAWVACEWAWPKLFGDTLGHGMYPSLPLRQLADVGGAPGITFVLLLVNEGIAAAIRHHRAGIGAWTRPLLASAMLLLAWWGYGGWRASDIAAQAGAGEPVRIAMVQSNIVDYERLRRERGAYAVVREVLDTHFAMSREAVEAQQADALLWSETVYPTTFDHAKSEDGAALDREIHDFVASLRTPLVFGSYDLDATGEYNAAAFLAPDGRLLGMYRKTRPFPLTEYVPEWLDGPAFRRMLPWTGSWQRGDGARVYPLQLADGRELPVLPLICLDDTDPSLAIDGARLGAQAIVGMSNDSWFSAHAQGAELHLAVASFRSIETRLPQFRVTANGISAAIDATGTRVATTPLGEPALLTVSMPVGIPPRTLAVTLGDWVGAVAMGALAAFLLRASWRRRRRSMIDAAPEPDDAAAIALVLLTPISRAVLVALQVVAVGTLAWLAVRMYLRDGMQVHSLAQLRLFAMGVLLPTLLGWWVRRLRTVTAAVDGGELAFIGRRAWPSIPARDIVAIAPWKMPLPISGLALRLADGTRLACGIDAVDPSRWAAMLRDAGAAPMAPTPIGRWALAYARIRAHAHRRGIDHPLIKFALFPLLLAVPAFRLHQHITYGGTFGEYERFGWQSWVLGLLIWWAAWSIGMSLLAAALRMLLETGTLATMLIHPARAAASRALLMAIARLLYFVGVPAWLLWRLLAA